VFDVHLNTNQSRFNPEFQAVSQREKFKTKPCGEANSFNRMAFDVDILFYEHHSKNPKDA
jgi:hypothetical protein